MKKGMTPDKQDYGDPLQKTIPSTASRYLIISIISPGTFAQAG